MNDKYNHQHRKYQWNRSQPSKSTYNNKQGTPNFSPNIKDKVLPKPIGSEKVADNSENDVNLATPCVNIVIPTSTRNISKPKLKNFRFGTTIDEITFFITTFLKI